MTVCMNFLCTFSCCVSMFCEVSIKRESKSCCGFHIIYSVQARQKRQQFIKGQRELTFTHSSIPRGILAQIVHLLTCFQELSREPRQNPYTGTQIVTCTQKYARVPGADRQQHCPLAHSTNFTIFCTINQHVFSDKCLQAHLLFSAIKKEITLSLGCPLSKKLVRIWLQYFFIIIIISINTVDY